MVGFTGGVCVYGCGEKNVCFFVDSDYVSIWGVDFSFGWEFSLNLVFDDIDRVRLFVIKNNGVGVLWPVA